MSEDKHNPIVPGFVPRVDHSPIRLAVLISGGGTTLTNILDKMDAGKLQAEIALVICSNQKAYEKMTQKLADRGVKLDVHKVFRKDYNSTQEFSDVLFGLIREAESDLVCLAGFLSLLSIPDDYAGQVINIHPALLPSFGGKGMHGMHVHTAVLEHGCKISGCTVHFADQTYDTGPIIVQKTCPVLTGDTPDTLQARVFEQECEAFPEAIKLLADGRVSLHGRVTKIK